jgi:HEPN domain-containing protein
MVDSNDYNKWVQRAKQDIRTIENNLKDDPEFLGQVICYMAQQAAEKLLKHIYL